MDSSHVPSSLVEDGVRKILTEAPPDEFLALMGPAAAVSLYREQCSKMNIQPNSTFVRAITAGSGKIDFTNSYFGERGLAPILATLRNVPFFELNFNNCQLTGEDVKHLQATFVSHPTATGLDLRGNVISMASARRLLSLAIQNSRITTILVDDDTPKAILIKRQCLLNSNVAVHASKCIVCQKSMIHSTLANSESKLILSMTDLFDDASAMRVSAIEFETFVRAALASADLNDGVLFLCSQECTQGLARDLVCAMQLVTHEVVLKLRHTHPRNPIVTRCAIEMIEKAHVLLADPKNQGLFSVGETNEIDSQTTFKVDSPASSVDDRWKCCSICGSMCYPLSNSEAHMLNILKRDLTLTKVVLRPSSFLRLLHLLLRFCGQPTCSRKCVRNLVRYGIHGLGGVHKPKPNADDDSVTSLGLPLNDLPLKDFAVFRFDEVTSLFHHGEEDTTCAVTIASLMTDIEGVSIDPYMIFALGRALMHQQPANIGMQLRAACQAVLIGGCLATEFAPFRVSTKPDRATYADWSKWTLLPDIEHIRMVAFGRRRRALYVVDGVHGNVFDNIRAAMWAFRAQRRACVTCLKFCAEWLQIETGVISSERGQKGGFLTTVKVVGQSNINSTFYLIIQPNFGKYFGNRGFFYISKSTFNRYCRGLPYIFLDFDATRSNEGQHVPIYRQLVSPKVSLILDSPSETLDVLMLLASAEGRQVDANRAAVLAPLLATVPPSLKFLFSSSATFSEPLGGCSAQLRRHLLELYTFGTGNSQTAFLWGEVLGAEATAWVSNAILALRKMAFRRQSSHSLAIRHVQRLKSVQPAVEEWDSISQDVSAKFQPTAVASEEKLCRTPVPPSIVPPSPGSAFRSLALVASAAAVDEGMTRTRRSFLRSTPNTWNPQLLSPEFSTEGLSSMTETQPFHANHFGLRWHCVHEPSRRNPQTTLLFFIGDSMCRFDCERSRLVTPLRPIAEDSRMAQFPFASGFDAVVTSPSCKAHLFFFSRHHWIVWDALRDVCVKGPNSLTIHREFHALPSLFHNNTLDLVMGMPHSSNLLFFARGKYVEYDVENEKPVTAEPLDLDDPQGPFAAIAGVSCRKQPIAVMKWDYLYNWPSTGSCIVVFKDLTCVIWDTEGLAAEPQTLLDLGGRFRQLPRLFLQATTLGWGEAISAALSQVPRNRLCHVELFASPVKPPASLGVTPSMPIPGFSVSWEVSVTSSLELVDNTVSVHTLIQDIPAVSSSEDPSHLGEPELLACKTILRRSKVRELADYAPDVITFDFGDVNDSRFAYACIALDLSQFDESLFTTKPIEAHIQCSWDGYCFQTVAQHTIFRSISGVYWPPQHAFRYWRIVFPGSLPLNVGIIRVLWYTAQWVSDSTLYEFTTNAVPSEDAIVAVDAENILEAPASLLSDISSQGVFTMPANDKWSPKHAILPIMPQGTSCLFFVGASFVEFSLMDQEVVGNRSVCMDRHPAFADLPVPFCHGFNAAVYPNYTEPATVLLLHGKYVIEWDLDQGRQKSSLTTIRSSSFFKGIPKIMELGVETAYNDWEAPGVIVLISGDRFIRWNVLQCVAIEGPSRKEKLDIFRREYSVVQRAVTAGFVDPTGTGKFFLFTEGGFFQEKLLPGGHFTPPVPLELSKYFHSIGYYLPWGETRGSTCIKIDLFDQPELVIGITLRSSDASNPGTHWRVECSDDGISWSYVATHVQSVPKSTSYWSVEAVTGVSHRFWSLTSVEGTTKADQPIVYSQLLLKVLPSDPFSVRPERMSHNGRNSGGLTAFLSGASPIEFPQANHGLFNTITFDYGPNFSPELISVSLSSAAERIADIWAVLFSDDGEHWSACGVWRIEDTQRFRLVWKPSCPRRFWRVEQRSSVQDAAITFLGFQEYSGPSVLIPQISLHRALELLLPRNPFTDVDRFSKKSAEKSLVLFEPVVGRTISIDFKGSPQSVISAAVVSSVDSRSFTTIFDVEYSSDLQSWCFVGSIISCDEVGTASWESEGAHRYWRLRVRSHHGARQLAIRRIELALSGLILYETHKRHLLQAPSGEFIVKEQQVPFVALTGSFPPRSAFAVEMRGPCDWIPLALAVNDSNDVTKKFVAWPLRGSSSKWRLRNIDEPKESGSTAVSSVAWLSFSGSKMEPVAIAHPDHGPVASALTAEDFATPPNEIGVPCLTWCFPMAMNVRRVDISVDHADLAAAAAAAPRVTSPEQPTLAVPAEQAAAPPASADAAPRPPSTSQPAKPTPLAPRIVVEGCADGVAFIPIASLEPPVVECATVISLPQTRDGFRRLRIRFISWPVPVDACQVTWFTEFGSASSFQSQIRSNALDIFSDAFEEAQFSYIPELIAIQDAAMQQAFAMATGLRQVEDMSPAGMVATTAVALQKAAQKHLTRQIKEASANQKEGVDLTAIMDNLAQFSPDVAYIAKMLGVSSESGARTYLADLKLMKDNGVAPWYFPKAEYRGTIGEKSAILGFTGIPITFALRYHATELLLEQKKKPSFDIAFPFLSDVATPIVMLNTVKLVWSCQKIFPNQTYIMGELGMTERQVIITVSSRKLHFTPKYTLAQAGTPAGLCVASPFPFVVPRGISVLTQLKLEKLPPSVAEYLRVMTNGVTGFMTVKSQMVLAVLSFDSWASGDVSLRFTVAIDSSLGISGLFVSATDVLVQWSGSLEKCEFSFVSRQATWEIENKTFPIVVSGRFSQFKPTLSLVAKCPSATWSDPHGLAGAVLGDIQWTAECMLEDSGEIVPPSLQVRGVMSFSQVSQLSVPCTTQIHGDSGGGPRHVSSGGLVLQLIDTNFFKLAQIASLVIRHELPLEQWMKEVPFLITAALRVSPHMLCAKGNGSATFFQHTGGASVSVTSSGVQILFKVPSLRLGSLVMHGWSSTGDTVVVEARCLAGTTPTIRLNGVCSTISETLTVAQVEMSCHGTLLVASGSFFEICMRDPLLTPIFSTADVKLGKQAFAAPLSKAVQGTPLTRSLISAGMPFSFSLQGVTAEPVSLNRKALLLNFNGVFFGCRFDLGVNLCFPGDEPDAVNTLCAIVAAHIMEQCSDSLWSSLDAFVGLRQDSKDDASSQGSAPFESAAVEVDVPHVRRRGLQCCGQHNTFLSTFILRECEAMDEIMNDALEQIF
jgi:hypothetical protein